ncbi:hypothetical protein J2X69_004728 [Algoriphagus sp. 4150]|uniref:outer membrane beta-barrel protein n=1 Tax=Algoriphagus sp. 4150 TaxID=2817756 RepID=UPI00285AE849|nr:outer membrane beta-barrel protein [Algoriphagus sp. 4150]MDR7132361.1 hypothetical protein [Algoriphagus sp. 4150]
MSKRILFLALSLILSVKSVSQVIFENGYFLNESNQNIVCLIKNIDWKNNPTEFEYMLSKDAVSQKASIKTVKEFGINGVSKYVRATVKLDRSSDDVDKMSSDRNPNFQEEQLFLKVLIEGKASLFQYEEGNLKRFFHSLNDSEISQLVYKRYLNDKKLFQNDSFKQQLLNDLKCQDISLSDIEHLKYTKRDIKGVFIKYNECEGDSYIDFESNQKKDLFNLSFRPGLNYSNLAIQNSSLDSRDVDFDGKLGFRFGIESEFVLPFNKNKWSIIVEPTYQYYKTEKTTETKIVSGGFLVSKVNYQSIELPIGVRHYFFINDKSKIFVDISYVFDFSTNSSIKFTRMDGSMLNSLELKSRRNLGLGIGYKYNHKYSIGMRYQTSREILGDYLYWDSDYKTLSMILGFSVF